MYFQIFLFSDLFQAVYLSDIFDQNSIWIMCRSEGVKLHFTFPKIRMCTRSRLPFLLILMMIYNATELTELTMSIKEIIGKSSQQKCAYYNMCHMASWHSFSTICLVVTFQDFISVDMQWFNHHVFRYVSGLHAVSGGPLMLINMRLDILASSRDAQRSSTIRFIKLKSLSHSAELQGIIFMHVRRGYI